MPSLDQVTPLILTLDEENNIGRALERLGWARRIVVVDSYSSDGTLEILRAAPSVEIFHRHFDTFADQLNYGLRQVKTEWVLSLDADYIVPDGLAEEIATLPVDPDQGGFYAAFEYAVFGRKLRASLYPPRPVLFRRHAGRYVNDGHRQFLQIDGSTGTLRGKIIHDDRKPFSRWAASQASYAEAEAEKLLSAKTSQLNLPDRLRRTAMLGPAAVFFYCLFFKGLVLDGWPGWYYTLQRVVAETILALRLIEKRFLATDFG